MGIGGWLLQLFRRKRVQVLCLQPGDKLVLTYPGHLSMNQAERIRENYRLLLDGIDVVVFDQDVQLRVLRGLPSFPTQWPK